jgi:hypothetical protein
MTAPGNIAAGGRILAADIRSVAPLAVIKGADETVTSSTTLQNDDALVLPVVANGTYIFWCYLDYEGGTQGSSDIKWQWAVPASATLRYWAGYIGTTGTLHGSATITGGTSVSAGTGGTSVLMGAFMKGTLIVSSTAGNIQLEWAQNTSSGTGTIVHAQSELTLWRIT